MNSKYAPIVALTAVIIIVIAALGWFLAIKPKLSAAADIRSQSEEVDQNVSQIQLATTKLTEYETNLAALAPLDDSVALNLPSTTDLAGYRARITDAAAAAKVSLVALDTDASYIVDGWQLPPANRVSTSIATLFATGPVNTGDDADPAPAETESPDSTDTTAPANGYTPVVTVNVEPGPVVTDMYGLPFTITVAGSYSTTTAFLKNLSEPSEQMFLVYETSQKARPADSATLAGVPNAKDGDVLTTITGVFYLMNPDATVVDDGEPAVVKPSGTSPFAPSQGGKGTSS